MPSGLRKALLVPLTLAAVLAANASSASASSLNVTGPVLLYTAAAAENNNLTITPSGGNFLVADGGAVIGTGSGCSPIDANHASCTSAGVTAALIDVGDGTNSASVDIGTVPAAILGSSGSDTFFAGAGNDTLNGLGGADAMHGGGGDDVINGGQANDSLYGEDGNDTFNWNPGDSSDLIEGGSGSDKLNFNGANINEHIAVFPNGGRVALTRDIAAIFMDLGSVDQLNLKSLGQADTIDIANGLGPLIGIAVDPGAGIDTINGGDGNETYTTTDGEVDTLNCGAGDDTFTADPIDIVNADCVDDPPPTPQPTNAPPDRTAAIAKLGGKTRQRLGKGGKITIDVTYNEPVTVVGSASVNVQGASKTFKFKGLTQRVAANKLTKLVFKLGSKGRRAVKRTLRRGHKPKVKVTLKATDLAGNSSTATRSLKLVR